MERSRIVLAGRALGICAALALAGPARAEDPALAPPQIRRFVSAVDPRSAAPDDALAREIVELELDVTAEGVVADARVTGSAGEALDEAALAAARAFEFDPATRDGSPIAARIRYTYVFEAREAREVVAPARSASVAGEVLDRSSSTPIGGARVVVTPASGPPLEVTTGRDGRFRLDGVPPGAARVVASAPGFEPRVLDEALEGGTLVEATLRLDAEREPEDPELFEATARVAAPPREVTKRSLSRDEITRMPGTRGDPLRAIELLPGVGRGGFGSPNVVLRGANLSDSQVFGEGAPVPILFHFGGLTSFVHGRSIESVDVYPSNFSVRYGRKVGGVIDVRLRDPRTDGFHGVLDLNLIDSSVLVETPVGERLSVLAAARRSNVDAVLNSAVNTADFAISAAPVYWDYQTVAAYRPTEDDRVRLVAFGSRDSMRALLKNAGGADPTLRGGLDSTVAFHNVQVGWRRRFRGGSEQNTSFTYGRMDTNESFGRVAAGQLGSHTLLGRSEWSVVVSRPVRIVAGVDLLGTHLRGRYTGIAEPADEGGLPTSIAAQRRVSIDTSRWILQPAAYVEVGVRPIPRLLLAPGVRADYNDLVREGSVDSRAHARFDVTDATAVKAGVGRYTGHPQESRVVEPIGNPNLGLAHALHASAGVEQKVGPGISVSAEGFARWIDGLVTSTPGGRPPFYESTQEGRVFGGELLVRAAPTSRFFGFLSYTLMRSERRDPGQAYRLFDRDTPHIVSAAAVYKLGRGWEVGAALRYTSGTPYTPVTSSTYDARSDTYLPRFGASMSERNPAFSRLDLRVEKTWTFSAFRLAAYLDVQNVLNSPNREGFAYAYDYARRRGEPGLPIFPCLGLRGEL